MKTINNFIIEKLRLSTAKVHSGKVNPPVNVQLDKFDDWLSDELFFNLEDIETFNKILFKKSKLDKESFSLSNYEEEWPKDNKVESIKQNLKKTVNSENYMMISNDDYNIYYINIMSNVIMPTIFIADKDINILYTYILSIYL